MDTLSKKIDLNSDNGLSENARAALHQLVALGIDINAIPEQVRKYASTIRIHNPKFGYYYDIGFSLCDAYQIATEFSSDTKQIKSLIRELQPLRVETNSNHIASIVDVSHVDEDSDHTVYLSLYSIPCKLVDEALNNAGLPELSKGNL